MPLGVLKATLSLSARVVACLTRALRSLGYYDCQSTSHQLLSYCSYIFHQLLSRVNLIQQIVCGYHAAEIADRRFKEADRRFCVALGKVNRLQVFDNIIDRLCQVHYYCCAQCIYSACTPSISVARCQPRTASCGNDIRTLYCKVL